MQPPHMLPHSKTHTYSLNLSDKYQSSITRGRTIFSLISVAIVQHSLALIWKENKC